jgi:hypothetical protein
MNNYLLIGAGGTGTHLLVPLVTYLRSNHQDGEWILHIIDGDAVETNNLNRQLFAPGHVTMNKATAAAAMINDGHVVDLPIYLSEENIPRIIRNGDTVFIAVDNFTVRKRIEDHCLTLDNIVVINGGNELHSGSVQLWVRADGKNVTPRLSYMHPEIAIGLTDDRAEMTCAQAAALPGGEQTQIANMMTATWMLTALWRAHIMAYALAKRQMPTSRTWTELQFDIRYGWIEFIDWRVTRHWNK